MGNSLSYICDRGLASRIHKELKITKHQENKLSDWKKWPMELNGEFSKKKKKAQMSNKYFK